MFLTYEKCTCIVYDRSVYVVEFPLALLEVVEYEESDCECNTNQCAEKHKFEAINDTLYLLSEPNQTAPTYRQ